MRLGVGGRGFKFEGQEPEVKSRKLEATGQESGLEVRSWRSKARGQESEVGSQISGLGSELADGVWSQRWEFRVWDSEVAGQDWSQGKG